MWKAQHLWILIKTQLLSCHLYVRVQAEIGYSGPPETEPAELLDALVQLKRFQVAALAECQGLNFLQRRGRDKRFQTRAPKRLALNLFHGRAGFEDDLLQTLAVGERPLSDHKSVLAFRAIAFSIVRRMSVVWLLLGRAQKTYLR